MVCEPLCDAHARHDIVARVRVPLHFEDLPLANMLRVLRRDEMARLRVLKDPEERRT